MIREKKRTEAKKSTTARLFHKMQAKFTLLVAVICSVLMAVCFAAMMIINTISLEVSIGNFLNAAITGVVEDKHAPEDPANDCLVVSMRNGVKEVAGTLGGDEADSDLIGELMSAAQRGEKKIELDDGRVIRIAKRDIDIADGYYVVYAFGDFSDTINAFTKQTLGMMFSFIALTVVLVLFSYMISGVVLAPAKNALIKQKDLVANASHELKTPITIINANLDVIKNSIPAGEQDKWISNIEAQTKRMNELIIEMLEMSSLESDAYKPLIVEFDLGELVEGSCLSFEAACFEKSVGIEYSCSGSPIIKSDEKGWNKLVTILLDNAVKYAPESSKIYVYLVRTKRHIKLSTVNDGEVPQEKLKRIFDRFYKAGDNSGSFGLGLAMAKVITGNMNGSITCESADGKTTFSVTIPLKDK